ncbi:MAG: MotA/TolQ/ExbB proton channel family protein [Caldimicrobium sp.]|nr:MotA/TolQ/ExbB proton channel family protein [Caldimicrobium sp.]MDW8183505.1 MotA/TolQ/ExbB proton channel family protein [Caldimicrobium sp.]
MEFFKFFWQIGLVGKFVLFVLLMMSIISWYYIFLNYLTLNNFKESLFSWASRLDTYRELANFIREVRSQAGDLITLSFKRFLTRFGEIYNFYSESGKKGESSRVEAEKEIEEEAFVEQERILLQLGKGLGFLATTANTAPFIGLFGTVWGIMRAFHEIGQKGSASLATVAPGIAEALINTAMGLLVAIPAAIAYNYFLLKREKLAKELALMYKRLIVLTKREFLKD